MRMLCAQIQSNNKQISLLKQWSHPPPSSCQKLSVAFYDADFLHRIASGMTYVLLSVIISCSHWCLRDIREGIIGTKRMGPRETGREIKRETPLKSYNVCANIGGFLEILLYLTLYHTRQLQKIFSEVVLIMILQSPSPLCTISFRRRPISERVRPDNIQTCGDWCDLPCKGKRRKGMFGQALSCCNSWGFFVRSPSIEIQDWLEKAIPPRMKKVC